MNYSDEELIQKYLQTIKVKPSNTRDLFVIGLIGLVGSGKSYLAGVLARKTNLYIASNDEIRRFLNNFGYRGSSPAQLTLQKMAEGRTRFLFKNRISHIIDADLIQFVDVARKNAEEYKAKIYFIRVTCPEKIIIERIKKREQELKNDQGQNLSRVGLEEYFRRKTVCKYLKLPTIFYSVDTSKDINQPVEEIIEKLKIGGSL